MSEARWRSFSSHQDSEGCQGVWVGKVDARGRSFFSPLIHTNLAQKRQIRVVRGEGDIDPSMTEVFFHTKAAKDAKGLGRDGQISRGRILFSHRSIQRERRGRRSRRASGAEVPGLRSQVPGELRRRILFSPRMTQIYTDLIQDLSVRIRVIRGERSFGRQSLGPPSISSTSRFQSMKPLWLRAAPVSGW